MKISKKVTKHYRYAECVCPCCDRIKLVPAFYTHMVMLEKMRRSLGFSIIINSGYRCSDHNLEVDGSKNSQHMAFATDVRPTWGTGFVERLRSMYKEALVLDFGGIGYYSTFIHLDTRSEHARWREHTL